MDRKYTVCETEYYQEWFKSQTHKSKAQIQDRIFRIEEAGHFGRVRDLRNHLMELKFNDGRRIYYVVIPEDEVILLLGGNKNGQEKDISYARKILKAYT